MPNNPTSNSDALAPVADTLQFSNSDAINKFIEVQIEDVRIRAEENNLHREELEIQKQQITIASSYAEKNLEANAEDLKTVRKQESQKNQYIFITTVLTVVLSFAFLGYCMYLGKDNVIFEILKTLAFIIGSGGVGYLLGMRKAKKDEEKENN